MLLNVPIVVLEAEGVVLDTPGTWIVGITLSVLFVLDVLQLLCHTGE